MIFSNQFSNDSFVIAKFQCIDPTMIAPAPNHDLPTHHCSFFFFFLGFVFTERERENELRQWMRVGLGRDETKWMQSDRSKSGGSWSTCGAWFYRPMILWHVWEDGDWVSCAVSEVGNWDAHVVEEVNWWRMMFVLFAIKCVRIL